MAIIVDDDDEIRDSLQQTKLCALQPDEHRGGYIAPNLASTSSVDMELVYECLYGIFLDNAN